MSMPDGVPKLTFIACETRTSGAAIVGNWDGIQLTDYGRSIDRKGQTYYKSFPKSDSGAYDNYRRNITVVTNVEGTSSSWISSVVGYFEDQETAYMLWKPADLDNLDQYWGQAINPRRPRDAAEISDGQARRKREDYKETGEKDDWLLKGLLLLITIVDTVQALHDQSILMVIVRPSFFRVEKGVTAEGGPQLRMMDMTTCEHLNDPAENQEVNNNRSNGMAKSRGSTTLIPGLRARRRSSETSLLDASEVGENGGAISTGACRTLEADASKEEDKAALPLATSYPHDSQVTSAQRVEDVDAAMRESDLDHHRKAGQQDETQPSKRESRNHLVRSRTQEDNLVRHHLRYLAPESTATKLRPTVLADQYSIGVCMYELVAERVIEGRTEEEMTDIFSGIYNHITSTPIPLSSMNHAAVPVGFSEIVSKCLSKDPAQRYVSLASLRYDLDLIAKRLSSDKSLDDFAPGKVDQLAKYTWLSEMQDREAVLPILQEIHDEVQQTQETRSVVVFGESGTGKSMLLERWVNRNTDSEEPVPLVGWAKLHQHLVRPLSGFNQIFKSLLDAVLTDPREDITEWRKRILSTFEHSSGIFANMIPTEWQELLLKGTDLEGMIGSHAMENVSDFDLYLRQLRSWCSRCLQVFIQARKTTMILVIDDIQWLSKEEKSLWSELIYTSEPPLRNVLVLSSYRTTIQQEVPSYPSSVRLIHVGGLSPQIVRMQLAQSFRWPLGDRRSQTLADILLKATAANPFHLKALLPILEKQGVVYFSWEDLQWTVASGSGAALTLSGLESIISDAITALPLRTQEILKTLACLPSRDVAIALLASLLDTDVKLIADNLLAAMSIGLVIKTPQHVSFTHDKQHAAALSVLETDPEAATFRLRIARRLTLLDDADAHIFDIVNNTTAALQMGSILSTEEIVPPLLQASQKANRSGAFDTSMTYLRLVENAMPVESRDSWEGHRGWCLQVLSAWTAVAQGMKPVAAAVLLKLRTCRNFCLVAYEHLQLLVMELRVTLALGAFASVPGLVQNALETARLSTNSEHPATAALLKHLPQTPQGFSFYAEVATPLSHAAGTRHERVDIDTLVCSIITLSGPTLFSMTSDQGSKIFSIGASLAFRSPVVMRHPASAYIIAVLGLLSVGESRLAMAREYIQLALQQSDHRDHAYETLTDLVITSIRHIDTPVSEVSYDRAWNDAVLAGNAEVLAYVASLDLLREHVRGHDVIQAAEKAKSRLAFLETAPAPGRVAHRALLQAMLHLADQQRPLRALTKLDPDGTLTESHGVYSLMYYTTSLMLCMLFEADTRDLLVAATKARAHSSGAPGILIRLEYCFTFSLFALSHPDYDDPPYRLQLMEEMRAFEQSPDTRIRLEMLDCLALTKNYSPAGGPSWLTIVERYDANYNAAVKLGTWTIAGFSAYLCAKFLLATRPPSSLATGYLLSAARAYQQAGCLAAHRKLQTEYPDIDLDPVARTRQEAHVEVPASRVDIDTVLSMDGIIRSFLVLATERDGEALLLKLLKVLLQLARADTAAIVLRKEAAGPQHLVLRAAGSYAAMSLLDVPLAEAGAFCPVGPLLHCAHTKAKITEVTELQRWKTQRFYRGKLPEFVSVLPLVISGELAGVLYLDSKIARDASVSAHSAEILSALATFAVISHESIRTTRSLEEAVKERTERLTNALEAQGSFLSHMSHELRTPLFAVLGLVAVLQDSDGLDQMQREHLTTIRSSGEDLHALLGSVLDFSKLESHSLEVEHIGFSLRTVVEGVINSLGTAAQSKGVYLYAATSLHTDPPYQLLGDPFRVKQCLVNLIGNAIKFTPANGTVSVEWSFSEKGKQVQLDIEVIDNGNGVPVDKTDRLFKSFSQVDSTITRTAGGTGLGLAITRKLAKLMNGDCTFRPAPIQGSVFRLSVGVEKLDGAPERIINRNLQGVRRAALIASNGPWREVLAANLDFLGITSTMTSAFRGELLALLRQESAVQYDFVILDDAPLDLQELEFFRSQYKGAGLVLLTARRTGNEGSSFSRVLVHPVKAQALCEVFEVTKTKSNGEVKVEKSDSASSIDKTLAIRCPLRILYVDDNKVNCLVGTKILQRFGYKNTPQRHNGLEAVDACSEADYDVVLLDLQMPVMDGFTAAAELQLRAKARARPVPFIVALTAHSDVATREKCAEEGFWGFLTKPLEIKLLKTTLEDAYRASEERKGNTQVAKEIEAGKSG